jgi:hypothetical protein
MRLRGTVVGAAVLAVAVGCSSDSGDDPAAAPTATSAAPTGTSAVATPSASPTPQLPPGCESLVPFTELDQALGRPLFGQTRAIIGQAQPNIGRTGRLTCQYGLPDSGRGTPPVEVGVSTYVDAASAQERVAATVASIRTGGGASSQTSVTVAGVPATVLGNRSSFTAVLAKDDRTIVVTVQRALRGQPDKAAARIAERVLANWAD